MGNLHFTDSLNVTLDQPAEERLTQALAHRYRIESEIGSGGMATVYLAQDLKHDRQVAVKVLKPELAAVVGAERFLAEIKTTANLQNPHILPLFDSGEAEGFLFYVMPFVEGESLREKLDREKHLPVEDAIRIAGEVADALDHAHRRGVIHRDIKPGNILLHEGRALVADFGIALAVTAAGRDRLTETGLSVGTPSYMSPEQASGEGGVDARSDLYSLAAVVYEMLSGQPPYTGPTAQAIVAKILTERPEPLRKSRPRTPFWVEEAVDRALERIPADRHASAVAFAQDLRTERRASGRSLGPSARMAIAATVLVSVAATVGIMTLLSKDDARGPEPLAPTAVERPLTFSGRAENMGISPDGSMVAYMTEEGMVARDVRGGGESVILPASSPELGQPGWYSPLRAEPQWLPDGSGVLFLAQVDSTRSRLAVAPRVAGAVEPVGYAEFPSGDPVAYPVPFPDFADGSGRILLVRFLEPRTSAPWLRIWDSGEMTGIDIEEDALWIWDAVVSPSGQWIAYLAEREDRSTYIGTVSTDGSVRHRIHEARGELSKFVETSAVGSWPMNRTLKWIAPNRLYFRQHGSGGMDLWQVSVDPESGEKKRAPRLVYPRLPRGTSFDISADAGALAFTGGPNSAHIHLFELDLNGGGILRHDTLTRGTGWNLAPALSADGSRIAFAAKTMSGVDLYVQDLPDGTPTRLNLLPRPRTISTIVWAPDPWHLAAHVESDGGPAVWLIDVRDGTAEPLPRDLLPGPVQMDWSHDGRFVLYGSPDGGFRIVYDRETGTQRRLFESRGGELIYGLFSEDGTRVLVHDAGTNTLWTDSVEGGDFRRGGQLGGGWSRPVRWARDGAVVVLDLTGRTVTSMPWEGGESRLLAELPVVCMHDGLHSMTADGRLLACAVRDWQSDVTVVENFDPEVAAATGAPGG
ncbi:MAG: protein kinase [Gemmatimonadota bacterium]|jgi:tRNA A-37 threonylcarbamoyl transferase component Bud32/WD40 repeat protein